MDLQYYPDKYCRANLHISGYYKHYSKLEDMPLGFNKYATGVPHYTLHTTHYHAALPPYLYLQRDPGEYCPDRLTEFLLKASLFCPVPKEGLRDLVKATKEDYDNRKNEDDESRKEEDNGNYQRKSPYYYYSDHDIRMHNCYK